MSEKWARGATLLEGMGEVEEDKELFAILLRWDSTDPRLSRARASSRDWAERVVKKTLAQSIYLILGIMRKDNKIIYNIL